MFLSKIVLQNCSKRSLWLPAKYPCGLSSAGRSTTNPRRVSSLIPEETAASSAGDEGDTIPMRDPLRRAFGFCSLRELRVIRDGLAGEVLRLPRPRGGVVLEFVPAGGG